MEEPKVGDPINAGQGEGRTVAAVIGKTEPDANGDQAWEIRDNTGKVYKISFLDNDGLFNYWAKLL